MPLPVLLAAVVALFLLAVMAVGVGSPLPRPTGGGHRGGGAGPRVTADKKRPVGQSAASAARTGRRRHVTTVSMPRSELDGR